MELFCSIFTAESAALLKAVEHASKSRGKFIIYTDSQSAVNAILNIANTTNIISTIKDILIKNTNKIKIMWIAGDCGIPGNDYADLNAKIVQ